MKRRHAARPTGAGRWSGGKIRHGNRQRAKRREAASRALARCIAQADGAPVLKDDFDNQFARELVRLGRGAV